jgi:arylsulfatase A-like enzyme
MYEETILVYSSDHGLAIGSHGLMGKQNLYEHSMKVPLIMAGPGIPPGESASLVYLLDLFPTLCELAGAPLPEGIDGRSFGPVLRGETTTHRESLLFAYRNVQRAIRDPRWKLIVYPQVNRVQLFDLESDPDELRDLASAPEHGERIAAMRARMFQLEHQLGGPCKVK